MKKFLILTSAIALSACFGGGGNDGSGVAPVATRAAMTADSAATQSNTFVTSMASELLVRNGKAITPSRVATAVYDGVTYRSYRLDNVDFNIVGEDSKIVFGLDEEGRIVSAGKYDKKGSQYKLSEEGTFTRSSTNGSDFGSAKTIYAWQKTFTSGNQLETDIATALNNLTDEQKQGAPTAETLADLIADKFKKEIVVQSDSTEFDVAEAFESKINKKIDDWAASQSSEWKESQWFEDVVSAAKDYYQGLIPEEFETPGEYVTNLSIKGANIGLKYADLGFADLQIVEKDTSDVVDHTIAPYSGGYKIIERNVSGSTVFNGTALAGIEHRTGNGTKEAVLVRQDNDAQLTLNTDGSSVLVMDNLVSVTEDDGKTAREDAKAGKWYKLTVEKSAGINGIPTFTIEGDNTIAGYNLLNVPTDPVTFDGTDCNMGNCSKSDTVNGIRYSGSVVNHAYGNSTSDLEATSAFHFGNENTNTHEEVAIYGVFGGKPTQPNN